MEFKSFFGKYGNLEIVFFRRRKKNWWSTCFCLVMEVTTQNSYFKFWILHGVGVGNGLNNDFLHFLHFLPYLMISKIGTHKKEIHSSDLQATFQFTSWINVGYLKILNFLSVYYMLEILSWTYIDRPNCVWHFDIFAKIYNEKEWTHTKILKDF